MKITLFLILFSYFPLSGFATEANCKTEFNLARYKMNLWGKTNRIGPTKMLHDLSIETFTVRLPVNADGSAYFSSSSHLSGTQRLDTYYKTTLDSNNRPHISLLFTSRGVELVVEREIVLSENRHSETIILDEPYLLENDGKIKIMIESISFNCGVDSK